MRDNELLISGFSISTDVVAGIVTRTAEQVEGVAAVGPTMTSSLVSVFTGDMAEGPFVESRVEDDKLSTTVHISVFFGYKFTELAAAVREAVARAITEQIGVEAGAVDVCIDDLVFPKE